MKFLELKNTMTNIKNSINRFKRRFRQMDRKFTDSCIKKDVKKMVVNTDGKQ